LYCVILFVEPQRLQKLLCAWTGWAILPEGNLEIKVSEECDFAVHTCFQQIEIPSSFSEDDLLTHFNMLIDFGSAGFGAT